MSDLKPCPFCGGTDVRLANEPYQVWCHTPGCKTRGPKLNSHPSMEQAIEAWNHRTPDHSALVRELVEALQWIYEFDQGKQRLRGQSEWKPFVGPCGIKAHKALTKAKEAIK